jgi:hypothetical protein
MSNETFMPCRRIIASAAEPRGGRRVRGRAERHAALAITSKTRFWYNIQRKIKGGIMTDEQAELVGRTFRHFKGNLYRLEGFAKDSETLEEMVVYRALYGKRGLWVRPAKMFFETVERDGRTMKRFELVED